MKSKFHSSNFTSITNKLNPFTIFNKINQTEFKQEKCPKYEDSFSNSKENGVNLNVVEYVNDFILPSSTVSTISFILLFIINATTGRKRL